MSMIRREVAQLCAHAGVSPCIVEKASIDEVYIDMTNLLVSYTDILLLRVKYFCTKKHNQFHLVEIAVLNLLNTAILQYNLLYVLTYLYVVQVWKVVRGNT